jgi:hypothetical protein
LPRAALATEVTRWLEDGSRKEDERNALFKSYGIPEATMCSKLLPASDIYTCYSLQGEGFVALLKQTSDSIIINVIECNEI